MSHDHWHGGLRHAVYAALLHFGLETALSKPHQHVVLFNSSEVQAHGVQDRWLQLQMFAPGEKREVCLVVDELATLVHLSRTDRGFYMSGPNRGKPFPPHPLRVLGLPPEQSRPTIDDREMELSQKAAALAAREAELVARELALNAQAGVK
jgi:hypothetical protein